MKKLEFQRLPKSEMLARSEVFRDLMKKRRTVRSFSTEKVDFKIIKNCIEAAGTAPNGANRQPWKFVVVSNPQVKKEIRKRAEELEKEFYESKASEEWLEALKPLGTGVENPFLEEAPYLIVVFAEKYEKKEDKIIKNYYVKESVGIATGILVAALHNAGLAVLTYTPSPMNFLNEVLKRPANETPFILLAVGFPSEDAQVPELTKKRLNEIMVHLK